MEIKKNDCFTVSIEDMSEDGSGIGKLEGYIWFIKDAVKGDVVGAVRGQPMEAPGMYGTILLHEDAGGYVLVGVISFTVAVVITALCIKLRERERHRKDTERENTPH